MSVTLTIDGNHVTDVISEVMNLATAFGGVQTNAPVDEKGQPSANVPAETANEPDPIKEPEAPKPKKLSAKDQDAEVARMIETGQILPEIFDRLSKTRQKKVTEGIEAKVDQAEAIANGEEVVEETKTKEEVDVESMFDEEPDAPEAKQVTHEDVRNLMGKLGKDETGEAIQGNLLKIRAVLEKFVPEGQPVKLGNIPEEELAQVHAEMLATVK